VQQLQALVEEHAQDRFGEAATLARIRELLHLSRQAADYRNSVLSDFWTAESDAAPIHALKNKSRASSRAAELGSVADNLFSVVKELDHERHHGCLHETTEAFTPLGD
jgi:hypothetical protein